MVSNSPNDVNKINVIEAQIRECFGRVVYSHKTQEKCADICTTNLNNIKSLQIFLSVITTGSFLANIFGTGKTSVIIGAISSAILLALNLYTKNFDFGKSAQKHKDTADKLWDVRESYLSLLTDINANSIELSDVKKTRDRLQKTLSAIYSRAPRTTNKAYKTAQIALKISEDMTFSDVEINVFLPSALHKNNNSHTNSNAS